VGFLHTILILNFDLENLFYLLTLSNSFRDSKTLVRLENQLVRARQREAFSFNFVRCSHSLVRGNNSGPSFIPSS